MSTVHELTGPAGEAQTQPSPPWPGAGAPPGFGGGGEGPGGPSGHRRSHRWAALIAGVAAIGLVAGAGSVLVARAGTSSGTVLTTAQIAARVDPGLVDITSTLGYRNGVSAGTGMVLTSSGEVLTNNHVVEGATSIKVRDVGNGRTYRAVVVGYDRAADIAVLQLQGAAGLKTVSPGDSSKVTVGQKVVALGNAGGRGGTPAVAAGRLTALGQTITASDEAAGTTEQLTGLIRSNAGIQAGDSGGPLVSTAGQVVGINTAASTRFAITAGQSAAQAFAIPMDKAESIAGLIEARRSSSTIHIGATAFLGVQTVSEGFAPGIGGSNGVAVAGVVAGTPAARAGLSAGDVITSLGGHQVTSQSALQAVMESYHPGSGVTVRWTDQAGRAHAATVVLAEGPVG